MKLETIHSHEIIITVNYLGVPSANASGGTVHGWEKVVKLNGREVYTEKQTWPDYEYKPIFAEALHSFEKAVLFGIK